MKMKSWLVKHHAPIEERPLAIEDRPVPEPSEGEIRIKVQACGVCHTDLHIVEGELRPPRLPVVPGHQVIGKIDAIGNRTNAKLRSGQQVGVPWLYDACEECVYCKSGRENLCDGARFTGFHVDGGYAEYMVVPAEFAIPVSEELSPVMAAPLMCAGIIGYRSLRLSGISKGHNLALFGFGASAHLVIQVARYWGCRVFVFTRSESHRELARSLGAAWAGPPDARSPELCDAAISFAPVGSVIPAALRSLKKGGTLAINAIHMDRVPEFPYDLLWGERVIRSVANVTRQDAAEFLELAARIPVKARVEVYDFNQLNEALIDLKQSKVDGAAVLRIE